MFHFVYDLFKAKKAQPGERRKWKDGYYIKGADHKWHKETLTQHAIDQLVQDGMHKKKKLVEDFTEAVHGYVDFLAKKDIHPEDATPESDSAYWEKFFDDPDWDEDEGFQKYTDKAHKVAVRFHKHLLDAKKAEMKGPLKGPVDGPVEPPVDPAPKPDPEPKKEEIAQKGGFKPSKYQQAIFDFVKNGKGNAIVDAVAGSGKSTTIERAFHLLTPAQQAETKFIAFNNHIKKELATRGLPVSTLHSEGFSAWRNTMRGVNFKDIDSYKVANIMKKNGFDDKDDYDLRVAINNLVSKAKLAGLVPRDVLARNPQYDSLMEDTDSNWFGLMAKYDIELPCDDIQGINLARKFLTASIEEAKTGNIDFDDMLYMPFIGKAKLPQYKMMFVDELQDLSPLGHNLVRKMLAKDGRFIGVGDPYQSMYAFAGADTEGMGKAKETFQATSLPLSICYRCPKSVVAIAKDLVPHIEAAPWAEEGEVRDLGHKFDARTFQPNDMILCRNNAPLVKMAYSLLRDRVACSIVGRKDFGEPLANLVKKLHSSKKGNKLVESAISIPDLVERLDKWRDHEIEVLTRRNAHANTSVVEDKHATIMSFIEDSHAKDSMAVKDEILRLFSEAETKGAVRLSSVHRAKGLEADNVFILNRHLMPSPLARSEDDMQQEKNIEYVAYTRPKKSLTFIRVEDGSTMAPPKPEETPNKQGLGEHLDDFMSLSSRLSPENLHMDGEATPAQAKRRYEQAMREWSDLEAKVGRKVTEDEVWHEWDARKISIKEKEAKPSPRYHAHTFDPTGYNPDSEHKFFDTKKDLHAHIQNQKKFAKNYHMVIRDNGNEIYTGPVKGAKVSELKKSHLSLIYKAEKLRGGRADGMDDSEFDEDDLQEGMDVEKEHTKNKKKRKEIAKDHLAEDRFYYKKLKKYVER